MYMKPYIVSCPESRNRSAIGAADKALERENERESDRITQREKGIVAAKRKEADCCRKMSMSSQDRSMTDDWVWHSILYTLCRVL